MFKAILLSFIVLGLSACHSAFLTDVKKTAVIAKPIKPKLKKNKQKEKSEFTKYVCKDNKALKISKINKGNKKQTNAINLTFGNTTHRLTKVVSESGDKYSNLSWQWQKRSDYGTLSNSAGKIIAEKCVLSK